MAWFGFGKQSATSDPKFSNMKPREIALRKVEEYVKQGHGTDNLRATIAAALDERSPDGSAVTSVVKDLDYGRPRDIEQGTPSTAWWSGMPMEARLKAIDDAAQGVR